MFAEITPRIRQWMFDEALPFWAEAGIDREHGGPVESLNLQGAGPSGVAFKRTRVVARQIYVFSHAALLGWAPARAIATHLFDFMVTKMWQGPQGGWPRTVTTDGQLLDGGQDLYDYAFALFALGWYHKASGEPRALELARQTLDIVNRSFRHPGGEGFHHELPADLPRQQNPHMHLIEAAIVLADTSRDQVYFDLAKEIGDLFVNRIARFPQGVLPEFFDDAWKPVADDKGRWVEPGHQFEWAWILSQFQKLSGNNYSVAVSALIDFAETHGVDPISGLTYNGIRADGVPIDRGSRTWPNTERIKGWIGLYELTGRSPVAAVQQAANVLFDRFLNVAPCGCWIDTFNERGEFTATVIPASSLYHIFLAFSEILRLDAASA